MCTDETLQMLNGDFHLVNGVQASDCILSALLIEANVT